MGIKHMNRYLTDRCSKNSICKSHLKIASGKTIVVDASIYMYKYMTQNALIEYLYLMISVLLEYNINPIFVFDGKAPAEKRELLRERSRFKKDAEVKYNELQKELDKLEMTPDAKKDALDELDSLKKKFIRIKEADIIRAKKLMDAYGITYLTAEGEADKLCALMVKTGNAWACLSDDMDMFVYGCSRVLRHMSLLKHTIILYDFDSILKDLELSEKDFREIMILAGTDYNIHQNVSLNESLKWFNEYSNSPITTNQYNLEEETFYKWLTRNKNRVSNYDELQNIYNMFSLGDNIYIDNTLLISKRPNFIELQRILREDGFVLC